ncbi:SMP-30/gluconolactonase/LRE family protein [Cohnella fermenti]|uniref:Regucalcin n=1 Tax=Cohnella fermenti TaxID=2565925 RepID=A0A4V3WFH8_9BACL|nr:SMP-30/gluconolactonase/LRE family protein [Cohnella fermenti]THF80360.1 SMP-30/gluconolactonase/LRE family protein [Cohnella fermenti]
MTTKLWLVHDTKAELGEGPVWDSASERLLWVDIVAGRIHEYDPQRPNTGISHELGSFVSSVVPRRSGGWAVTRQDGYYAYNPATAELARLAEVEGDKPGNRFNDGKCDPVGRYLAGTMSLSDKPGQGALYALDAEHAVRTLVGGIGCSNGLAWSADGSAMYYIDTPTRQVVAYDYDLATGAISGRRIAIAIPEDQGYPDGMTIDSDGMLWIAHWGGWQVSRWNPLTGDKLLSVPVPAALVTSCAFGGPALDKLYITTARVGLSAEDRDAQPQAGGLFCAEVGATGLPSAVFGG